ncbi:MAG: alpha/beta hydrolase [Pseudomonadota bacterium]
MKRAADIVYDEAGPITGRAEPILCLHGIGGDTGSFGPQLTGLSDTYRVLSWAMPGYGGSAPLAETTFETLSAAAIRLMDALEIGKAHLAGQSIGGMIAQDMALRYPDRVASLILIGTTPSFGGRDDTFKTEFLDARLKPLDAGLTMPELAERFVPEIVGPIADAAAIASATRSMAAVPVETYRTIMRCLVTFNRRDDLGDIARPCCLIAGSHDKNAPPRTMEKMAARLPDAVYHLIDGAGHLINLEAPDACNALIRDFLTSIEERP